MSSQKKGPLDHEVADRLLSLLGSDDGFREQFKQDPLAALGTIGYQAPRFDYSGSDSESAAIAPFAGCRVMDLASKDDILGAKDELRSALTQGLAYTSPNLEASAFTGRTRK
jgi:putative modified peptide